MNWLKKLLFKKELQELDDLREKSALLENRASTLESEMSNIQKAYGEMQELSREIEDEQNRLEKAFVKTLNKDEREAYLKGVAEIQESNAGKVVGTLTSTSLISVGLLGKSAAGIAGTLAAIGGTMVGGIALIASLPFLGWLFDKVKGESNPKKNIMQEISNKKAQYFRDNQQKMIELAASLESSSKFFEELMLKKSPKQITHK